MHLGSEIPHYYTRYTVTIKGNIAVIVTFSAHKLFYTKYSSQFFRAIKSLRVVATKSSINRKEVRPRGNKGVLGDNLGLPNLIDDNNEDGNFGDGESDSSSSSNILFLLAFLLAAVGVYIWFKRR